MNNKSNNNEIKAKFNCEICGRQFKLLHRFTCHIATAHEGMKVELNELNITYLGLENSKDVKNWKCQKCELTCSRIGTLKRHVESVHEKQKNFKCEICGKTFARRDYLNGHVTNVHRDPSEKIKPLEVRKEFGCDMCEKSYRSGPFNKTPPL